MASSCLNCPRCLNCGGVLQALEPSGCINGYIIGLRCRACQREYHLVPAPIKDDQEELPNSPGELPIGEGGATMQPVIIRQQSLPSDDGPSPPAF